ncbi:MAG: hypothetical protein QOF76_4395, partial [Solirubrobacteraceae bacterium]|nr:hypothetical protein [Solirubrobacteraceae bacterium]
MRAWCAAVLLAALVFSAPAGAAALKARTFRVDNALPGKNPDGVTARPVISGNGYVIAYDSDSANLADDPNGFTRDVFVRSLSYTRSLLVSTGLGGKPANGRSVAPAISSDGFTVAYQSSASNLTPGDRNHHTDVFLRHAADPTQLVSVARDGGPANGDSAQADISANGRFVAFTSAASNLVTGDTNHHRDVFLRDMRRGVTVRVSH